MKRHGAMKLTEPGPEVVGEDIWAAQLAWARELRANHTRRAAVRLVLVDPDATVAEGPLRGR